MSIGQTAVQTSEVSQINFEHVKKKQRMKRFTKGILFLLPSIVLFSVFLFYPMVRTIYLSFFLTTPSGETTVFVGWDNYVNIFASPIFLQSMKSTFLFVLYTVPITIIASLFLAVIANEKLKGIGFFRTIYSSTMGVSVAAASVFWLYLFHPSIGLLNKVIEAFGFESIGWLTNPDWALFAVSISTIWMNLGFTFLILLGGLQSIDSSLYESANIDGAGYFYQLRRITIPMLSPTLFFVVTVTIINAFQTFGQIDILTQGGPQNTTNLIVYSIYREAFMNYKFGSASAQAIILFIIILIMTIVQFKIGEKEGSLSMTMPISKKIILYILMIISAIVVATPIIIAFVMSFMNNQDIMTGSMPQLLTFDNYVKAFDQFPLLKYLLNSFIVAFVIMLGQLILSSLAAYAFVFLEFKGRDTLFYIFIATMMVPFEASIIPNFHIIRDLNWIDSYQGLSIPFFAMAFGTFLLRQNFKQIPKELKEASEITGMGDFKFYLTVVLPVARTSLVTLGAYGFLTSWNMYLWPLLATTNDKVRTVQIGLKQLKTQEQLNDWGVIMAGAIIVVIPTLILLFLGQKQLQKGLTEGALK